MLSDPTQTSYIDTSRVDLVNCRRLPARLTIEQVGFLLGFQVYELVLLIRMGKLRCLGSPSPNSRKMFSAHYIESLASNFDWLHESTKAVAKAIQNKNRKHNAKYN
jgi:hypothetical protein